MAWGRGHTHSWQRLSWLKMHFWRLSRVRRLRCSSTFSSTAPPAASAAARHLACGQWVTVRGGGAGVGWGQEPGAG